MKAMFFDMLDQGAANAVNNAFWRTGCAARIENIKRIIETNRKKALTGLALRNCIVKKGGIGNGVAIRRVAKIGKD